MNKVITIYDAKTNLSKYIKQAKAGSPVYIGGYGEREVILMAAKPHRNKIKFGTSGGKIEFQDNVLEGNDQDIQKMFYGDVED